MAPLARCRYMALTPTPCLTMTHIYYTDHGGVIRLSHEGGERNSSGIIERRMNGSAHRYEHVGSYRINEHRQIADTSTSPLPDHVLWAVLGELMEHLCTDLG